MELDDVEPSEITFQKKLFASQYSTLFFVTVRDKTCIMKVHHGRGPVQFYEPKDRELDIHVLESTAYRRLKEHGLCDLGIVPQFFGSMRKFDPSHPSFQPHLRKFLEDEYPPSAIFVEYIPNLEMIHLHNYTKARMDNLVNGILEIHKAFVLHNDASPRNMLVVKDDPERVVWIDFDRARTYNENQITEKQQALLTEEKQIVLELGSLLEADIKKGKLDQAYIYYCT